MIYIQSNNERTLPHHFDCSCALYGAIDLGEDYRLTTFEEVESGKFDALIKTSLFVGSVEFMREVFKRAGKTKVRLPMNSNRPCRIITLAEAFEIASSGHRIFIKPVEIKLFTGFVLDQSKYSCLNGLPEHTEVFCYSPFPRPIASEWRAYILENELIYCGNYAGSVYISPDYRYIRKVINQNRQSFPQFPCAYTIDMAILKDDNDEWGRWDENEVVEFNDMWAIGNYGMPNDLYVRALKKRYFEIMK